MVVAVAEGKYRFSWQRRPRLAKAVHGNARLDFGLNGPVINRAQSRLGRVRNKNASNIGFHVSERRNR